MSKTIRIGREMSNDKVLNFAVISHRHAELTIQDDGKCLIRDLGSTNGTYVNGKKIQGEHLLRPGDRLVLASVPFDWERVVEEIGNPDNTTDHKHNTKDPQKGRRILWAISIAVSLVLICGAVLIVRESKSVPSCFSVSPKHLFSYYQKSVVLLQSVYTYDVTYNGAPISDYIGEVGRVLDHVYYDSNSGMLRSGEQGSAGTGFFITDKGHILTNRHVLRPDPKEKSTIEEEIRQILSNAKKTKLAQGFKVELNNISVSLSYNGVHLNDYRDMKPCTVYKVSEDSNVDLAIIQLNDKKTPEDINIIDLNKMAHNTDLSLGEEVFSLGFPYSTLIGITDLGVEANNQNGTITQERDEYVYGNNINILPGASGSPVFDKRGRLCGVVVSGFLMISQGYNHAILPDVIDDFVGHNLKTINLK